MKSRIFITIPILNKYYGRKPFKAGRVLKLVKDFDNELDPEAIKVTIPGVDTIGYVANSVKTVYSGTASGGRLYDKFDEYIYAIVVFVTKASVIASIIEPDEAGNMDFVEMEEYAAKNLNPYCIE